MEKLKNGKKEGRAANNDDVGPKDWKQRMRLAREREGGYEVGVMKKKKKKKKKKKEKNNKLLRKI